jgi:hypothetical protein
MGAANAYELATSESTYLKQQRKCNSVTNHVEYRNRLRENKQSVLPLLRLKYDVENKA